MVGEAKLEAKLEQIRAELRKKGLSLEEDEREAGQHERIALDVERRLDGVAEQEASGAISAREAEKSVAHLRAQAERHAGAAAQRRRVANARRREIAELKLELAMIPYRAAVEEYEATARTHERRAGEFVRALAPAVKAAEALLRARSSTGEAFAMAKGLCPEGEDLPNRVDEPEWPDVAQLQELLAAGRIAPVAAAADAIDAKACREASNDESILRMVRAQLGNELMSDQALRERIPVLVPDRNGLRERVFDAVKEQWERNLAAMAPERRQSFLERLAEVNGPDAALALQQRQMRDEGFALAHERL